MSADVQLRCSEKIAAPNSAKDTRVAYSIDRIKKDREDLLAQEQLSMNPVHP